MIDTKPRRQWKFDPTILFFILMVSVVLAISLTMALLVWHADLAQTDTIDAFRREHDITREHVTVTRLELECVLLIPRDAEDTPQEVRNCINEARVEVGLPPLDDET